MPRRDRPDADALAAWRGFLRVHRALLERLDHDLQTEHDLPLSWYDVLLQVTEAGGELTMGEIAERLLISPSTCTRVVDRMHAAGLVDRRIDDGDGRVRHVSLTAAGRARLRAAAITHLAGIERHFGAALGGDGARLAAQFDAMLASLHG